MLLAVEIPDRWNIGAFSLLYRTGGFFISVLFMERIILVEFLAIVHALALMKQKNINMPVYSDSRNALSWVKQKKCKTKLERTPQTEKLFQMIERAEIWLERK